MSDSSDEQRRPEQSASGPTDGGDSEEADDVQALRQQVEQKYDFSQKTIYAV